MGRKRIIRTESRDHLSHAPHRSPHRTSTRRMKFTLDTGFVGVTAFTKEQSLLLTSRYFMEKHVKRVQVSSQISPHAVSRAEVQYSNSVSS